MKQFHALLLAFFLILLVGCGEETQVTSVPEPIALTEDAAGHYCQMIILDHPGPKAQMFMAAYLHPLWFSQVRDGLARMKSAERTSEIQVLYVNDMGAAKSWQEPGVDNWIKADSAFYVVGSDAVGGMGAPEFVPFSSRDKADQFAHARGGNVLAFTDISAESVLSPIDITQSSQKIRTMDD
ncbi:nitrous oxide reductase accessory protein NosL [Cohaesibacter celericrescens]|jgi:copper chaperone NosL|uniref:Copper resistance protein CopZ n=1 Tax=Cohaesibacter celericrescens TaxID=2067669 RepID=A0A2N5XUL7_9HYPH|nr:nitrous oxide reductase accessory protein NosL [Cohaesibacter celericrescens]PLW78135.1 copper resistance protein CopZ [Cohaesibacter celericrescens]